MEPRDGLRLYPQTEQPMRFTLGEIASHVLTHHTVTAASLDQAMGLHEAVHYALLAYTADHARGSMDVLCKLLKVVETLGEEVKAQRTVISAQIDTTKTLGRKLDGLLVFAELDERRSTKRARKPTAVSKTKRKKR